MERQTPKRNWRYVHHNRKQSEDSMDNSIDSVQSARSGKFNRFQFKKEERAQPKESIFALNSKHREGRREPSSIASKQSLRELDTSKISENQPFIKAVLIHGQNTDRNRDPTPTHPREPVNRTEREPVNRTEREPVNRTEREPVKRSESEAKIARKLARGETLNSQNYNVKEILHQVKGITEQFKKVIGMFSKKYRDMRYEWDRSFKALLTLNITKETQTIFELKAALQKKQEELDQIIRNPLERQPVSCAASGVKLTDNRAALNVNSSFQKLSISKVAQLQKQPSTLSRNNTIADILSSEAMRERQDRAIRGLQVRSLRQGIKRMQQILQQ